MSRLSLLFFVLKSSLRLISLSSRTHFIFSLRSLLSVVERLARRDGLSAMAVSVLVLMEDRQLCAIICAPSYSLFSSADLPFTDVHTKFG